MAEEVSGDTNTVASAFNYCQATHAWDYESAIEKAHADMQSAATIEAHGLVTYPLAEVILAGFDRAGNARLQVAHVGKHDASVIQDREPFSVEEIKPDERGVAQFSRAPKMSPDDEAAFFGLQIRNAHLGLSFFREHGVDYFELYR